MRAGSGEPRRRGRRPAGQDTRAQILEAAREQFAEHGYDKASGRAIARAAGVDPALVRHYFPSKSELFAAAFMPSAVNPLTRVAHLAGEGPEIFAEGVLRTVLSVWDSPSGRARLRPIFAGLVSADPKLRFFREFLVRKVFSVAATGLEVDHAEERVSLVVSQLAGLLMTKLLLEVEPLASMDHDAVVRRVAPTLVRYLTAPYESLAGES